MESSTLQVDSSVPALSSPTPSADPNKIPKFNKFAANIAALSERTRLAREELEKMLSVTAELKEQCAKQEKETTDLEKEQANAIAEVELLKKRIDSLSSEKSKIEAKLDELRNENSRLDAFVKQHEASVTNQK